MQKLIAAVLIIPMILVISTAVFQQFAFQSRTSFEESVTNELLGVVDSSPKTFTLDYPAKPNSASVWVLNTTSNSTVSSNVSIDYKSGLEPASVAVNASATGNDIKAYANYTAYSASGYSEWKKTYTGTFTGLKLGANLPFIYITIAVIGVILGAFGIAAILRR